MSTLSIRTATPRDREAIRKVEEHAFGRRAEAALVDALVAADEAVIELVAEDQGKVVGHILFSRIRVRNGPREFPAVALAPLAVEPSFHRMGIGGSLIRAGHLRLEQAGEALSVVLGDPAYYGRFGYSHACAAGFTSDYQCDALQALVWNHAPSAGQLVYPSAFTTALAA